MHRLVLKFSDESTVCSERGNNGRRQEEGHLEPQGFLDASGLGRIWFFSLAALLGFIRSAFPRVLFQPPSILKVGLPSDYALGEVSEK